MFIFATKKTLANAFGLIKPHALSPPPPAFQDIGADPSDDKAVMNHLRERLIKGIPVTKFSRSGKRTNYTTVIT